jgi:ATP synthase protein I
MSAPEPDDLRALGRKIDEARGVNLKRDREPSASGLSIALRFATELGVALFVGAGLGWLLDRWLHTAPIFIVIMFVLGAAAGIRNVMRAAAELNAETANHPAPAVKDEDEE